MNACMYVSRCSHVVHNDLLTVIVGFIPFFFYHPYSILQAFLTGFKMTSDNKTFLADAQLTVGGEKGLLCPCFKIEKIALILKKSSDCVHQ